MIKTNEEKARSWDYLCRILAHPGLRDTAKRNISAQRRAVELLLAKREELPPALVIELDAYMVTLEGLYLEAADGFADIEGVLNYLHEYIVRSAVGSVIGLDADRDHLRRLEEYREEARRLDA